jgi:hypothetical protein
MVDGGLEHEHLWYKVISVKGLAASDAPIV